MNPSVSIPIFEQSAEQIASRLSSDGSVRARRMHLRAQELTAVFQRWREVVPTADERVSAIKGLFELHREAMDYFACRSIRPASSPESSR